MTGEDKKMSQSRFTSELARNSNLKLNKKKNYSIKVNYNYCAKF